MALLVAFTQQIVLSCAENFAFKGKTVKMVKISFKISLIQFD